MGIGEKMRVNKHTLIWAAKQSSTVSEMAKKLGKDESYEEKIWDKLLRLAPGAEDFLERNEQKMNMFIAKNNGDDQSFMDARLGYIGATMKLFDNHLLDEKEIEMKSFKLAKYHKKNTKNSDAFEYNEKDEDTDGKGYPNESVLIASEVPQDLLNSICRK